MNHNGGNLVQAQLDICHPYASNINILSNQKALLFKINTALLHSPYMEPINIAPEPHVGLLIVTYSFSFMCLSSTGFTIIAIILHISSGEKIDRSIRYSIEVHDRFYREYRMDRLHVL